MFDFLKSKAVAKTKYMHIAIDTKGVERWSEKNKLSLVDGFQKSFSRIKELMQVQVEQKIPILSFLILPLKQERRMELLKEFNEFIIKEDFWKHLRENKIKVTVLGQWYDLPSEIIGNLKCLIEGTKDYDYFFLNFCLNYDGQEELLDAVRLINRQVLAGKLSPENITKQTIKDNIYTSYFIPPDLVIKNSEKKMDSFFLWDCVGAKRHFTEKYFPEFSKSDFEKVLK
tara:strand:- start:41 stop:724 length:684 start_codon:yes stop_codon:yes gene_type:complete